MFDRDFSTLDWRGGFLRHLTRGGRPSLVEILLAAPIVLVAVAAVVEIAGIVVVSNLVAGGVREASRSEVPGFFVDDAIRQRRIVKGINDRTFGLVKPEEITVTALVYPDFEKVGAAEPFVDADPINGTYDPGEQFADLNGNGKWDADMGIARRARPGEVVVYTATVDWPIVTPLLDRLIGAPGKVAVSAKFAVLNDSIETASGK